VRVAQTWAGKHWGAQFIPRLGQEVLVAFIEGDPDRPVVVGSVYNGEQTPPFDLPGNQAQWGFRSRSTKGGASDSGNELRFDDSKGAEDIYLKAEKDFHRLVKHDDNLDVKHSQTVTIANDRTITLTSGDDNLIIKSGNHTIKVSMGKTTIEAMQGIELKVGGNSISIDQSGIKIKGIQVSIEGQAQAMIKGAMTDIKGDAMVQVKGAITMIG
jgi:type VI secretion system secreted protein VgrG